MSESNCIVITRHEFFGKLDILLSENKDATMVMVFIPHEALVNQHLCTDEEEKLILDGWERFSQSFLFSCYCMRSDWRTYLILIEDQSDRIVKTLKTIFYVWEESIYSNLWRISFTNLKKSKYRTRRLMQYFESVSIKTGKYSSSDKLFEIQINIHEGIKKNIPLN